MFLQPINSETINSTVRVTMRLKKVYMYLHHSFYNLSFFLKLLVLSEIHNLIH